MKTKLKFSKFLFLFALMLSGLILCGCNNKCEIEIYKSDYEKCVANANDDNDKIDICIAELAKQDAAQG
jgi:outer membrane murein-binding lipoprotein Lpp